MMLTIFSRKKKNSDNQDVVEIIAEVPVEDLLNKNASQMASFLYGQILDGMAQRYIEMNYNETVADLKPQILASEILRQAALKIAEKMIESLKH